MATSRLFPAALAAPPPCRPTPRVPRRASTPPQPARLLLPTLACRPAPRCTPACLLFLLCSAGPPCPRPSPPWAGSQPWQPDPGHGGLRARLPKPRRPRPACPAAAILLPASPLLLGPAPPPGGLCPAVDAAALFPVDSFCRPLIPAWQQGGVFLEMPSS
ncbi:hypothetical protein U9M48_030161 [Paspalum notatum var. saurae]|uniref:Uncharacterized protein n=1 Tax=Paspalum notatum var. saurae TaxID=547442 RepID=A0AAQ3X300_PASNO